MLTREGIVRLPADAGTRIAFLRVGGDGGSDCADNAAGP